MGKPINDRATLAAPSTQRFDPPPEIQRIPADQAIRLECLRIAASMGATNGLKEQASALYDFVVNGKSAVGPQ